MEDSYTTYRGILHNHSACSKEGCYPLEELRRRWTPILDFAAMTEHAERTTAADYASYVRECDALSNQDFRFIPGLEVATESGDMLLIGCRVFICTRDPFQVLQQATEAGNCFVLLAHPEEGKMLPAVLEQAHGMEGWNGGHMGGYMPPIDWLSAWHRRLPAGKVVTGGNDIHKIDPQRKIVTLVQSASLRERDLLDALKKGRFTTSNGLFSLTPRGHVLRHRRDVSGQSFYTLLARGYRQSWQGFNACLEVGATVLTAVGLDKQQRTRLNRLIRQRL